MFEFFFELFLDLGELLRLEGVEVDCGVGGKVSRVERERVAAWRGGESGWFYFVLAFRPFLVSFLFKGARVAVAVRSVCCAGREVVMAS